MHTPSAAEHRVHAVQQKYAERTAARVIKPVPGGNCTCTLRTLHSLHIQIMHAAAVLAAQHFECSGTCARRALKRDTFARTRQTRPDDIGDAIIQVFAASARTFAECSRSTCRWFCGYIFLATTNNGELHKLRAASAEMHLITLMRSLASSR